MKNLKVIKACAIASIAGLGVVALPAMAAGPDATPAGKYTFSGTTHLNQGSLNATCTLTLMGNVTNTTNPEGIYLDITGGQVTGSSFLCGQINLSGFTAAQSGTPAAPGAWEAFKSDSDVQSDLNANALGPIALDVQAVTVSTLFGTCQGAVTANFLNGQSALGDPSYFTFDTDIGNSNCAIETTNPTGLVVQPSMSDNADVNVQ